MEPPRLGSRLSDFEILLDDAHEFVRVFFGDLQRDGDHFWYVLAHLIQYASSALANVWVLEGPAVRGDEFEQIDVAVLSDHSQVFISFSIVDDHLNVVPGGRAEVLEPMVDMRNAVQPPDAGDDSHKLT